MNKKRPPHLLSIGQAAIKADKSRSKMHALAIQGLLGKITTWGSSSVALVDLNELRARGYIVDPPEPRQFTAADLHAAICARDAEWVAAIVKLYNARAEAS